nr:hypothetical protein [Tanacetum cinerariifolium]
MCIAIYVIQVTHSIAICYILRKQNAAQISPSWQNVQGEMCHCPWRNMQGEMCHHPWRNVSLPLKKCARRNVSQFLAVYVMFHCLGEMCKEKYVTALGEMCKEKCVDVLREMCKKKCFTKIHYHPKQVEREKIAKPEAQLVGTSDGTKIQEVDYVDSAKGLVYKLVVEGPLERVVLTSQGKSDMSISAYYNQDDPYFYMRKW